MWKRIIAASMIVSLALFISGCKKDEPDASDVKKGLDKMTDIGKDMADDAKDVADDAAEQLD